MPSSRDEWQAEGCGGSDIPQAEVRVLEMYAQSPTRTNNWTGSMKSGNLLLGNWNSVEPVRQRFEGSGIVVFAKAISGSHCGLQLNRTGPGIGCHITRKLTRPVQVSTWAPKRPEEGVHEITATHRLWQLLELEVSGFNIDSIGCRKAIAQEKFEWELITFWR